MQKKPLSLCADTLALLRKYNDDGLTYLELHKATGLNPEWLMKFKQGKIPDPSVNKVETLYNFLIDYKPAK